jgi:transcription elongation factor Elf1
MFSFVTNRTVASRAGREDAGRVKAFVRTGSTTLEGDLTCPECGQPSKISQTFRRPLVVKCAGCGETVRLARLKDEIKKDRKRGTA